MKLLLALPRLRAYYKLLSSIFNSIALPKLESIEKAEHNPVIQPELVNQWAPTIGNTLRPQLTARGTNFANNKYGHTLRLPDIRILVAEDNVNNQQVARELLECEGAIIHIANNGQEAIDAITHTATPFDLVLMDLQMPVMDGFTATTHIRVGLGMQHMPIIAMTANTMTSDREACLAAGMNNHVGKPFDLDHLINTMLKHLNRQDAPPSDFIQKTANPPSKQILTKQVFESASNANVDLITALNRIGNKSDLYLRMLNAFIKEIDATPELLQHHFTAGEFDQLRQLFHELKGSAGTLGVNALMNEASWADIQFGDVITVTKAEFVVNHVSDLITSTSLNLKVMSDVLQARQNELNLAANITK